MPGAPAVRHAATRPDRFRILASGRRTGYTDRAKRLGPIYKPNHRSGRRCVQSDPPARGRGRRRTESGWRSAWKERAPGSAAPAGAATLTGTGSLSGTPTFPSRAHRHPPCSPWTLCGLELHHPAYGFSCVTHREIKSPPENNVQYLLERQKAVALVGPPVVATTGRPPALWGKSRVDPRFIC